MWKKEFDKKIGTGWIRLSKCKDKTGEAYKVLWKGVRGEEDADGREKQISQVLSQFGDGSGRRGGAHGEKT